jgi:serine/threonine protein kinase
MRSCLAPNHHGSELELRLFETLKHPNIVKFHGVAHLQRLICLVIEYCTGAICSSSP